MEPIHINVAVGLGAPAIMKMMETLHQYRIHCVRAVETEVAVPPAPDGVPYKVARAIERMAILKAWDSPEQMFPNNMALPRGTWRYAINGFIFSTGVPHRRGVALIAEPLTQEPDERRMAHLSNQAGAWVFTYYPKGAEDEPERGDADPGAEAPGDVGTEDPDAGEQPQDGPDGGEPVRKRARGKVHPAGVSGDRDPGAAPPNY